MTRISKLKLLLSRERGKERRAKEKVSDRRYLENKFKQDCENMGYWDLASDSKFKYSPTDWIKREEYLTYGQFKQREENTFDVSHAVYSSFFWRGYIALFILAWFIHY